MTVPTPEVVAIQYATLCVVHARGPVSLDLATLTGVSGRAPKWKLLLCSNEKRFGGDGATIIEATRHFATFTESTTALLEKKF